MNNKFDANTFPTAVKQLFEQNNYEVSGPKKIHGAEVDLIATPKSDPFGSQIYIEATIEHVGNTKYGKDLTKFALIKEKDSSAKFLIVSLRGFSLPVKERAAATKIETLTYDELFSKFERFDPYISLLIGDTEQGRALKELSDVYEEHFFDDKSGKEKATDFLTDWRDSKQDSRNWLIIVGEYGTGKTALTKILQYRWAVDYHGNASLPIPFRIELRDFTRQFDASGLIHHFLDHNNLGHIPIEFVFSLIRTGRVVLILDGYDEMAQYLHARERRACLETLADLSSNGAKGILTSRPNYFSEAEEFQIFETLYSSLEHGAFSLEKDRLEIIEKEQRIDNLIQSYYLDRFERILKDLTPLQTEALVSRHLQGDPQGKDVILNILRRIFRTTEEGSALSLSGKPVIISYLLEVVEQLKEAYGGAIDSIGLSLNEWQVYKIILDKLMLRDYKRAQFVLPDKRRSFLQTLSVKLTDKNLISINEQDFKDLIRKVFKNDLRRISSEDRETVVENYFSDLRSSSTLTRSSEQKGQGWKFSHNSLREFLLVEALLQGLKSSDLIAHSIPISDPMRLFVDSLSAETTQAHFQQLSKLLSKSDMTDGVSVLLNLFWNAFITLYKDIEDPVRKMLTSLTGEAISLKDLSISGVSFSKGTGRTNLSGGNFSGTTLNRVSIDNAICAKCNFTDALIEDVDFINTDLSNAIFSNSLLYNVNFKNSNLKDANFVGVDNDIKIIVPNRFKSGEIKFLEGLEAIGYLKYNEAITSDVSAYYVYCNHPRFTIVEKICTKLNEQITRQIRGLRMRGAARVDTQFADKFVSYLKKVGFAEIDKGRNEQLNCTTKGKEAFARLIEKKDMCNEIETFLRNN